MITIWKYIVPKSETFKHQIPKGAKFLSVQLQDNEPQMWFLVDSKVEMEERKFFVALTGQEIPKDLADLSEYLETVQISGGAIVLHLFELLDPITAMVKLFIK